MDASQSTSSHRWSGWPGAWCLDCGSEDLNEVAIAYGEYDWEAMPDLNKACPEPGSHHHDPYWRAQQPSDEVIARVMGNVGKLPLQGD